MKKLLSYLLLVVMMFSLSACGSKDEKAGKKADVDVFEFLEDADSVIDVVKSNTEDLNFTIGDNLASIAKKFIIYDVISIRMNRIIP